jgi:RalA-binding protein 1
LFRLVSELPPPNYALLRALTAHLILIVANAQYNKMTLRNIGIVFSPTLGIPAGIFSELVSHFGAIFDDEPEVELGSIGENGKLLGGTSAETEETVRRKRNSMLYQAGGADAMLGLGGRALDPGESGDTLCGLS